MCAIENPHLIPALLFYTIALIMWATSYNYSNHPSPWKRCEVSFIFWGGGRQVPFLNLCLLGIFLIAHHPPSILPCQSVPSIFKKLINRQDFVHIDVVPYQGYEASLSGDELEKARRERVQKLLFALKSVAARVSKEKKKGDPYYYLVATEDKNPFKLNLFNFLDSPLQSIHLILKSKLFPLQKRRDMSRHVAYTFSNTLRANMLSSSPQIFVLIYEFFGASLLGKLTIIPLQSWCIPYLLGQPLCYFP